MNAPEKLIKIGAKVIGNADYMLYQVIQEPACNGPCVQRLLVVYEADIPPHPMNLEIALLCY
jgi:hypothetical protein